MKILVVGLGHVGASVVHIFEDDNEVYVYDNSFKEDLVAQTVYTSEVIFLCLPTNFNGTTLDTKIIDSYLCWFSELELEIPIIIKSTLPIGFLDKASKQYPTLRLIYIPEFLRENFELSDAVYPDRIIVGLKETDLKSIYFIRILLNEHSKIECKEPILFMSYKEAELAKLASNTYLAMRVCFFNEIDSIARELRLDSSVLIQAISKDSRIGNFYNTPSLGYGGYCLPKDVLSFNHYLKNSKPLIGAISASNDSHIKEVLDFILENKTVRTVGIYKLGFKENSNSIRNSASYLIAKSLKLSGIHLCIYDPANQSSLGDEFHFIDDLCQFKEKCDFIIANRFEEELSDVRNKLYCPNQTLEDK